MILELQHDLDATISAMPPHHPQRSMLSLLRTAIRRDIAFIARHPTTLFQCVWNNSWNKPETSTTHLLTSVGSKVSSNSADITVPAFANLLDTWAIATRTRGAFWLRSLRPGSRQRGFPLPPATKHPVTDIAFASDGRLASAHYDKVQIVTPSSGDSVIQLDTTAHPVSCLAWTTDGTYIISGSYDCAIHISGTTGPSERTILGGGSAIVSVAYSSRHRYIITGSRDGVIRFVDFDTGETLEKLAIHSKEIADLAVDPAGLRVASASFDKTTRIWELESATQLFNLRHNDAVTCVTFSHQGHIVATGALDGTIRLWNSERGTLLRKWRGHNGWISSICFTNDDSILISGTGELLDGKEGNVVQKWDANRGVLLGIIGRHSDGIRRVRCSPCGTLVASGSDDGSCRIWNIDETNGKEESDHNGWITSVRFSESGTFIVTAAWDGTVRLWKSSDGTLVRVLNVPDEVPVDGAFVSDDESSVIALFSISHVGMWDIASGCMAEHLNDYAVANTLDQNAPRSRASSSSSTFLARRDREQQEVAIQWITDDVPVAWFPDVQADADDTDDQDAHPSGRSWAWSVGSHLAIVSLEGPDNVTEITYHTEDLVRHAMYAKKLHDIVRYGRTAQTPEYLERTLEYAATTLSCVHANQTVHVPGAASELADILSRLGIMRLSAGRWQDAEPVLTQASHIYLRERGSNHPYYAVSLNNLGLVCKASGYRSSEAETHFSKAVKILEQYGNTESIHLATGYSNLAGICATRKRNAVAHKYYSKAIKLLRECGTKAELAIVLSNAAGFCDVCGENEKARKYLEEAMVICKSNGVGESLKSAISEAYQYCVARSK